MLSFMLSIELILLFMLDDVERSSCLITSTLFLLVFTFVSISFLIIEASVSSILEAWKLDARVSILVSEMFDAADDAAVTVVACLFV